MIIDVTMGLERCNHCIAISKSSIWMWKRGSKLKYLKVLAHLCKMNIYYIIMKRRDSSVCVHVCAYMCVTTEVLCGYYLLWSKL